MSCEFCGSDETKLWWQLVLPTMDMPPIPLLVCSMCDRAQERLSSKARHPALYGKLVGRY